MVTNGTKTNCLGVSEGTSLDGINHEIECKTRLVEELERTHATLAHMRSSYEDKLSQLHYKILNTEKERDEVLLNMSMYIF